MGGVCPHLAPKRCFRRVRGVGLTPVTPALSKEQSSPEAPGVTAGFSPSRPRISPAPQGGRGAKGAQQ